MQKYRVIYRTKIPGVSNRRRIALTLKDIYWGDRKRPKDWYWFEGNIDLEEVPELKNNGVDIICSDRLKVAEEWFSPIIMKLREIKEVDAILLLQENVENNWITIFSRPY